MSSIFHLGRILSAVSTDGRDRTVALQDVVTALTAVTGIRLDRLPAAEPLVFDFVRHSVRIGAADDAVAQPIVAGTAERLRGHIEEILRPAGGADGPAGRLACEALSITLGEARERAQSVAQEGCWSRDSRVFSQSLRLEGVWPRERLQSELELRVVTSHLVCTGVSPEVLDYVCHSRIREFVCCGVLPHTMLPDPADGQ